ncbi:MAG: four-carbon acid sugar kinase family protein, partial [Bacteroidota bacterium]
MSTPKIHSKASLFAGFPPSPMKKWREEINDVRPKKVDVIIVLDDDPTGTQTVYDLPVLTSWSQDVILTEFQAGTPTFFILTNSRSLTEDEAIKLAREIGQNIANAATITQKEYLIISRGDSTLRGHYPAEVDALERGLGLKNSVHFLVPAFFEGGRYTVKDVHYVQQGEQLIPAGETPYSRDKVFGYTASNLREWVTEKRKESVATIMVESIAISELRSDHLLALISKLNALHPGTTCIVNAITYEDLHAFAWALLQAEVRPVLRTAASFVRAITGLPERNLLTGKEIVAKHQLGGLIVVGSYVPKSSQQLHHLTATFPHFKKLEIDVETLLNNATQKRDLIAYSGKIDQWIEAGQSVLIYTSRKLITVATEIENQQLGQRISNF